MEQAPNAAMVAAKAKAAALGRAMRFAETGAAPSEAISPAEEAFLTSRPLRLGEIAEADVDITSRASVGKVGRAVVD